MGTTKRAVADALGVSKQTVTNYIARMGLDDHIERVGKTDVIDDYAAAALADALGKSTVPKPDKRHVGRDDDLIAALNARIESLEAENARLSSQLEALTSALSAERAEHGREVDRLHRQASDAAERADRLAVRLADIADRQQAIAAAHWWQRGRLASRLLGPGADRSGSE